MKGTPNPNHLVCYIIELNWHIKSVLCLIVS